MPVPAEPPQAPPPATAAQDEVAPVRPGEVLDWAALERHLLAHLPELRPPMEVLQFPHGSANLTYLLRFGGTELVLRRPPFGAVAPGAHDMRREHRVLSRLWQVFDRAPRAYLLGDDPAVIGSDFVVLERRTGEVLRGALPASMRSHPDVGRRVGLALVDAMADLHLVDPASCDLTDLGRPEGFVQRQLDGWQVRWERVRPEDDDGASDAVHRRLAAAVPPSPRPALVHNDLKLDNCQFQPGDPDRVTSIFDWDMTTLGDPLVDLGTLLSYWPDPADPPGSARARPGEAALGLPPRQEVVERYAARTGIDPGRTAWYEAFALWKTAVVVQQLHDRWRRGESSDPRMATIADRGPGLVAAAAEVLDLAGC